MMGKPAIGRGMSLGVLCLFLLAESGGAGGAENASLHSAHACVAVTYFHGTFRCPACLEIERLAKERG